MSSEKAGCTLNESLGDTMQCSVQGIICTMSMWDRVGIQWDTMWGYSEGGYNVSVRQNHINCPHAFGPPQKNILQFEKN